MKLKLDTESSIKSIQKEFSRYYPFLKIEFYKNYSASQPLLKSVMLNFSESVKKFDNTLDGVIINIDGNRKVSELENDLGEIFGLSALVFRRSGNVWVETTLTEDWTLEEQNKEGEQISFHF